MGRHKPTHLSRRQITNEMKHNELFEKYYKGQNIVAENEWNDFIKKLQEDLPITFRVTGFRDQNKELLRLIKENYKSKFIEMQSSILPTENVSSGSFDSLPWYPNEMAWQLDASKYTVRKSDEYKIIHQFLVSETESGNISRQEAVSMLPPLVLDVRSHHAVLDMCAAPGSKSAQLVELLHSDAENKAHEKSNVTTKYAEPTGMVIANDVDQKRCYMMIHQVKRLQSPCVLITQEDAGCYPRLYVSSNPKTKEGQKGLNQLFFDRVLTDVPCSGDGTIRKNPDIWFKWTPNIGTSEHNLQQRILRRGLELLRDPVENSTDFSRLVYSTCSFNPVENEAVVASVLEACQDTVRLIEPDLLECDSSKSCDTAGATSKFKTRPGLTTWRVMDKKGNWYSTFDEVPQNLQNYLRPSLFPPSNISELHLERCRRVLPHDQNTGGFFIAVLEKIAPLPWLKVPKSSTETSANSEQVKNVGDKPDAVNSVDTNSEHIHPSNPKKSRIFNETPFSFINPFIDSVWHQIRDYYQIHDESNSNSLSSVPKFCASNILARSNSDTDRRRCLYYTNSLVKNVVTTNGSRGLKLLNTGVRMFEVMEDKQFEGYRLLQDGVELSDAFLPPNGGRRIHLTPHQYADLILLLEQEMPLISSMTEETQLQWRRLTPGPVLIDYSPESLDQNLPNQELPRCRLIFAGWRGLKSLRHYVSRHERLHIMRLANIDPKPCIMGYTKLNSESPKLIEPTQC